MEGGEGEQGPSLCTICGDLITDPATVPTCMDCFCQPCISKYIEVVDNLLSSKIDQVGEINKLSMMVPCPNCGTTFHKNNTIRGRSKSKNKSHFSKSDNCSGLTNSPRSTLEKDLKDSIQVLVKCQDNFTFTNAKLQKLQQMKLEHFNNLQLSVKTEVENLVELIRHKADSILHHLSQAERDFKVKIKAKLGYYKFLNENASNLRSRIEHLLNGDTEFILNNHKMYLQRIKKINSSRTSLIPESLLSKYKLEFQIPTVEFASIEVSSEKFEVDNHEPIASHNPFTIGCEARCKWSYRLQGGVKSSSLPSGICFWPTNKNIIVTEHENGTLLGFNIEKQRPDKPYHEIARKDKFLPVSLVRMDKGEIWCSGLNEKDLPNFAMIDKWTEKISIFDVHKKLFVCPFSRKFSTLNGLAYCAEREGNFVVTDQFSTSLEMIDVTGSTLWKMGSKNSSVFSSPCHIAIDYNHKRIFVTDERDLHFLDFNGQYIKKKSAPLGQSNWNLTGISLMKDGSILIADGSGSRVLKLDSKDGCYLEEVLSGESAMGVRCMDVSSDHHLALGHGDGRISLHKL